MSKDIRRIGDNSANINPIEEEAIKFIKSIYEDLIVQQKYTVEAIFGKNKTVRDINKRAACNHLHNQILNKFKSWKEGYDKR